MSARKAGLVHIVDDDEAVRNSTGLLLRSMDYEAATFASAEAFLASGDGGAADCLLLDYHLGGMNGAELLELLRQRGVRTPAIILTADNRLPHDRLMRAGAVAVLAKPPVTSELLALIEQCCAHTKP